jgi:hypothetical protein
MTLKSSQLYEIPMRASFKNESHVLSLILLLSPLLLLLFAQIEWRGHSLIMCFI